MFTINLDKECGCFKRSDLDNNMSFESKDDALMKATQIANHMNDKFCQKHQFTLSESGDVFQIELGNKPAPTTGGCCGGGHC